ncbi:MAG: Gfo/Idh/MocA family protein [Christensenellales bacterium]|jgi:UDP-N-acetyl-2-amino-2-deoxyglucuronate dehydrogenase
MKTWKVALIGCGAIAQGVYLPQFSKIGRAEMVAVCDIIPERAKLCAERFGIPAWYAGIDELLEKCDFDILMQTASIPAHFELNLKALKAGKHLYSQKPCALTPEEVTQLIEVAEANNMKFEASPIHMLRPDIRYAKKLIDSGALGHIALVRCSMAHGGPEYFQFRDADPTWFFRPGAGAMYDMGVHALHCVTGLLGPAKSFVSLSCVSQPQRTVRSGDFDGLPIDASQLQDNYVIALDFGNGTLGEIEAGFCKKALKTPSIEVYGAFGSIAFTDDGLEVYLDIPEKGIRGWMKPEPYDTPNMDFYQCSVLGDLIRAIESDTPVTLRPEHARHVIEIMEEVQKPGASGKYIELKTTF